MLTGILRNINSLTGVEGSHIMAYEIPLHLWGNWCFWGCQSALDCVRTRHMHLGSHSSVSRIG